MPRTPRTLARRPSREPAPRAPSERWLRTLLSTSDAARRFFDPEWYRVRHPDVLAAGVDPVTHYAEHGAREGRDPSPLVSAPWYAELVGEVGSGRTSVLEHLVAVGDRAALAPSPFVDPDWYGRRYPDATEGGRTPLEHLWHVGRAELRSPSPYVDLAWYAQAHPDVERSGIDALTHFVTIGHGYGWWPHPWWDEEEYLLLNPSARAAVALHKARSGFEHFCGRGAAAVVRGLEVVSYPFGGRVIDHVERRHLREHPDVAEEVASGRQRHGLEHLFSVGRRELAAGTRSVRLEPAMRATEVLRGGAEGSAGLVVLLAHHDRDGLVDEHVVRALTALTTAGAAVHLVSSGLTEEAREQVLASVATVIIKHENTSTLDFGSWALALDVLGDEAVSGPRWLVLANDSSYFPVRDPGPMFDHLHGSTADLWAATDSLSWGRHHLQSYFLALGPRARDAVLPGLRHRLALHSGLSKVGLIQRFEVGLTRDALAAGLDLDVFRSVRGVLAEPERVELARHRPGHPAAAVVTNLTHHLWRGMLRAHGLPFLKVELLRDNPLRIDVADWQGELDPDWVGVIERHLARVRRTAP